jgi:hypothetical protein
MKYLMALLFALLVPTAAMAKGECKEDRQKFCKEVTGGNENVWACLRQHKDAVSEPCKAKLGSEAEKPADK